MYFEKSFTLFFSGGGGVAPRFLGTGKKIKIKRKSGVATPRIFIFILFLRKSVWKLFFFERFFIT